MSFVPLWFRVALLSPTFPPGTTDPVAFRYPASQGTFPDTSEHKSIVSSAMPTVQPLVPHCLGFRAQAIRPRTPNRSNRTRRGDRSGRPPVSNASANNDLPGRPPIAASHQSTPRSAQFRQPGRLPPIAMEGPRGVDRKYSLNSLYSVVKNLCVLCASEK